MQYQYLLFDADNTLFDFDLAEDNAFHITCDTAGILWSESLYRAYSAINDSLWKKLERGEIELEALKTERFRLLLLQKLGAEDNEATVARAYFLRTTYMDALAEQGCLIDGAEAVVAALSERYTLYLVTNGIGHIQRSRFSRSSLQPYFRDIFISEELGVAKPDPMYFDRVIETIGDADRTHYLVIGDSLTSDCDGAIAAGLDICYYDRKRHGSAGRALTYTVHELAALPALLRGRSL